MSSSSPRPAPVVAIIAAAGQGTRLRADKPKAFVELAGISLLERSIKAMHAAELVDEIIVVAAPDMLDAAAEVISRCEAADSTRVAATGSNGATGASGANDGRTIRLVPGRGERVDSVMAGLEAISVEPGVDPIVLVHDAARALTPASMIDRVARAVADGASGVVPVLPVVDTIKTVTETAGDGEERSQAQIVKTVDRSNVRAAQTPQGFRYSALFSANEMYFASAQADAEAGTRSFVPTDDASLLEWQGVPVVCVDGDELAFKITTRKDVLLAQAFLADGVADGADYTAGAERAERVRSHWPCPSRASASRATRTKLRLVNRAGSPGCFSTASTAAKATRMATLSRTPWWTRCCLPLVWVISARSSASAGQNMTMSPVCSCCARCVSFSTTTTSVSATSRCN